MARDPAETGERAAPRGARRVFADGALQQLDQMEKRLPARVRDAADGQHLQAPGAIGGQRVGAGAFGFTQGAHRLARHVPRVVGRRVAEAAADAATQRPFPGSRLLDDRRTDRRQQPTRDIHERVPEKFCVARFLDRHRHLLRTHHFQLAAFKTRE